MSSSPGERLVSSVEDHMLAAVEGKYRLNASVSGEEDWSRRVKSSERLPQKVRSVEVPAGSRSTYSLFVKVSRQWKSASLESFCGRDVLCKCMCQNKRQVRQLPCV